MSGRLLVGSLTEKNGSAIAIQVLKMETLKAFLRILSNGVQRRMNQRCNQTHLCFDRGERMLVVWSDVGSVLTSSALTCRARHSYGNQPIATSA